MYCALCCAADRVRAKLSLFVIIVIFHENNKLFISNRKSFLNYSIYFQFVPFFRHRLLGNNCYFTRFPLCQCK